MNRIQLSVGLFFLSSVVGSSLFAQKLDCQKFRDGNFKIFDETTGTSIIRRKGNTQVETNDKYSLTLEFSVHWLDNCTYTLTPKKDMPELGIDTSQVLTVTITQTKERSYMQTTSSNFSDLKRSIEITKIEE